MIFGKKSNNKQPNERACNILMRFVKQVFRPFRIIYIHGMAFFLWVSFTLIGGLIGIVVSLIRNSLFGELTFTQAMYIESQNGSFYTYSIAVVASVLSAVFIVFAENNRLQFRRHQIVTEILLKLTSEFKVGKAIDTGEGGIWFTYEQILRGESPSDYIYVFSRSIKILSEMLDKYSRYVVEAVQQATGQEQPDLEQS